MALFGKKKDISQAGMPPDMGMAPQQPPMEPYGGYEQDYGQYPPQEGQYPPQEGYPEQYPPGAMGQQMPPGYEEVPAESGGNVEEIAEAIVEEKWNEKKREIDKILEWKEEVNTKITQLQQQINDLKASFDSLHRGMLGKISEYDENLTNVGTEIKAMEKVFSKVLPSLTDSVNKLQRMSDNVKRK